MHVIRIGTDDNLTDATSIPYRSDERREVYNPCHDLAKLMLAAPEANDILSRQLGRLLTGILKESTVVPSTFRVIHRDGPVP
jgi:hypothetical protein